MLSLIVATSKNNVIGHLNKIPWYMPKDLKHFSKVTSGHTVIMGRNTYESIASRLGGPLPNRTNIVITRQQNFHPTRVLIAHSLKGALENIEKNEEAFIIGGSQIYNEALPMVERIYRTLIHTTIEGDAFFPELDKTIWELREAQLDEKDDKNQFDATYEIYERKK